MERKNRATGSNTSRKMEHKSRYTRSSAQFNPNKNIQPINYPHMAEACGGGDDDQAYHTGMIVLY